MSHLTKGIRADQIQIDDSGRLFFATLGSGSKGNAALLKSNDTIILIDCGLPAQELYKRLDLIGVDPKAISATLITHEHGDHIYGLRDFYDAHPVPVYMTRKTYQAQKGRYKEFKLVQYETPFHIDHLLIEGVKVSHDSKQPVQYLITSSEKKFAYLTDTGMVTPLMREKFSGCHAVAVEFNYDTELLQNGKYPNWLKGRVASDVGHLSNEQAADFVSQVYPQGLKWFMILHISQNNNSVDKIADSINSKSNLLDVPYYLAKQDIPTNWVEV
jgi:phosphoribosyl 1,2-cyclic phosphodiesterase